MPKLKKQNGENADKVSIEKTWIEIHSEGDLPINTETFLVNSKVADYIEQLEQDLFSARKLLFDQLKVNKDLKIS